MLVVHIYMQIRFFVELFLKPHCLFDLSNIDFFIFIEFFCEQYNYSNVVFFVANVD